MQIRTNRGVIYGGGQGGSDLPLIHQLPPQEFHVHLSFKNMYMNDVIQEMGYSL